MNLAELESKQLLPRFAHGVDWIQDAFDAIIKMGVARSYTLAAPLSMESIHGLTDSELQEYYNLFGLAIYYPDLSRNTRELMLYNLCRLYRFLGTPRAIEILCQYIMDSTPIEVHIDDLFAFDDSGNLRHEDLLDVFDVALSIQASELPEETLQRIYENIIRFKNDRTLLRGFSFIFDLTGGGLDVPVAYTDGGNFETFFELNTFSNAPVPYKATGFFTWNHSQVQINAGAQRDVNPPLTAYTEGFSYRPIRYYSGVADTTGVSADGLLLVNNNGNLALYNNKGTAIRIQRLDYEYEPCTVIYPNQDKSTGQCAPNGSDISLYTTDGARWSILAYPTQAWCIHRAYASASDMVGFETHDLYLLRLSSSTMMRNLSQSQTITWQRAEAVRVWSPLAYSYTAAPIDGTLVYTFTLTGSGIPSTQAVHVYGYCRGRDAQGTYHYYKVEGDYVCQNHAFSITVESPFDGAQNASQSLIITKI